jgi:hypothetical protein
MQCCVFVLILVLGSVVYLTASSLSTLSCPGCWTRLSIVYSQLQGNDMMYRKSLGLGFP